MNPFSLDGKRVLITGASSGIGRASAIICAEMGATIIAVGRNHDKLSETLSRLSGTGHLAIVCELTDKKERTNLLEKIETKLDGIVACAGTLQSVSTKFIDHTSLLRQFEVNFFSVAELISETIQSKLLNKGSSVVLLSSVSANGAAEVGNAIYASTKGALQSYSRVLALELANRKIRVNCIAPGIVCTPFLKHFEADENDFKENEKKYPLGYGMPEDVANTVVYLLSDASRWMTGSAITMDGGLSL